MGTKFAYTSPTWTVRTWCSSPEGLNSPFACWVLSYFGDPRWHLWLYGPVFVNFAKLGPLMLPVGCQWAAELLICAHSIIISKIISVMSMLNNYLFHPNLHIVESWYFEKRNSGWPYFKSAADVLMSWTLRPLISDNLKFVCWDNEFLKISELLADI